MMNTVNDRQLWDQAVAAVTTEYATLPEELRSKVRETAGAVRQAKREIHRIAEEVECGAICASCGGECCGRGKYHVTVVDILVYLAAEEPLFSPRFGQDACPYLGDCGCLMEPSLRPFNCVTFNCERVEGLWSPERLDEFYRGERGLRALYGSFERLFGNRFMQGLLMNYERDVAKREELILRHGVTP